MAPRMTIPTRLVLQVLLADPERELYGLELCAAAGLPSGTIHPILARLERAGWVESRWEAVDPSAEGRPRRRYYRMNPNSIAPAAAALARAAASAPAALRLHPGLAGGDR